MSHSQSCRPRQKVMLVFGTRPEAIKMAPVVMALRGMPDIDTCVAVTAQHRHMLDQALDLFGIVPDEDLNVMAPSQSLPDLFARILVGLSEALDKHKPNLVVVHGDTSTTIAAALSAFYAKVPVAHVEAGLRTGSLAAPWPEEANRRLTSTLATVHFAPTVRARGNLLAEGVPSEAIHVTGNTVVDALLAVVSRIERDPDLGASLDAALPILDPERPILLVTSHRRENFGQGLIELCSALVSIAEARDVQIVYPVHLNPNVQGPVSRLLAGHPNILLVAPLDYLPFVRLMSRVQLILTDSGGIQEEAPSLGKPVLVMRDTTERPEAVEAGLVRLVGTNHDSIVAAALRVLDKLGPSSETLLPTNPYGDGRAATRVAKAIHAWLTRRQEE